MKLRNITIITIIVCLFIIGSVSASEDSVQDNLSVQTQNSDIKAISIQQDTQNPFLNEGNMSDQDINSDVNISTQDVNSDEDIQNKSNDNSSKLIEDEIATDNATINNDTNKTEDWKTFNVSDYKTLHSAATTNKYDKIIINLKSDIILKRNLFFSESIKKLIINGNNRAINGNKKYHIVVDGVVTMKNTKIINCYSSLGGGINNKGKLEIINCRLENNKAKTGGAIYNANKLIIKNSVLKNNQATDSGGAIGNDGYLSIKKSVLSYNTAKNNGAISNYKSKALIVKTTIRNNYGKYSVGAINNDKGSMNIIDTTLKNNRGKHIGTIHNYYGKLIISNSKLINNIATEDGGAAISNSNGKMTIKNCIINNNVGKKSVGAIFNVGSMTIDKTTINNNKAQFTGAIGNYGKLTVKNSKLNNNYVKYDGGAITNYESKVTLLKCAINNNQAMTAGGAICNVASLTISHCTLYKHKSPQGGAILNRDHGKITIKNCKLKFNKPGGKGTIKIESGKVTIIKTTIK